jgi:hypothetical protein
MKNGVRVVSTIVLAGAALLSVPAPPSFADTNTAVVFMTPEEALAAGIAAPTVAEALVDEAGVEDDAYTPVDGVVDGASVSPPPQSSIKWDTVMFSSTTEDGYYAPTRYGSGALGYSKGCDRHNLCNPDRYSHAYTKGHCKDMSGTRCVYWLLALEDGQVVLKMKFIMDLGKTSQFGPPSDGRNTGTLTAYCVGYDRCPSYVNEDGVALPDAPG